ncbi:hypothetical protein ABN028_04035 [Actinopolymorpha sp. B17G11]|uniref:hypothetical protein n=1 Tax=Actinopolymorpha sp. B17G11 TaxID=3160861 RepID=UPI0032E4830A
MIFAIRPVQLIDYEDLRPLIDPHDPEPKAMQVFARLVGADSCAIIGAYRDDRAVGYVAAQDYGPHLRHGDFHRIVRMHDLIVTEISARARRRYSTTECGNRVGERSCPLR